MQLYVRIIVVQRHLGVCIILNLVSAPFDIVEACEVVRLFVNKATVPAEPKRRGNPGYGRAKALRTLVYPRLKGLDNDTRVIELLQKHKAVSRTLDLYKIPNRTIIGR
jgi:hypothetical protein